MTNEIVYVVGDKFAEFGKNEQVVTIGDLERQIEAGSDGLMSAGDCAFVAGQGLQPERVTRVREALSAMGYAHCAESLRLDMAADEAMTHKRSPQNIMITVPRQVGEKRFAATIQLNDLCGEMADHMTGQHIQGVVLIEAARQMFLAVVGKFLLDPARSADHYFVVNRLSVDYLNFAFPLPLDIDFTVTDQGVDGAGNLSIQAHIEIWQAGTKVSDVTARFAIYRRSMMRMVESIKAKDVLDRSDKLLAAKEAAATTDRHVVG